MPSAALRLACIRTQPPGVTGGAVGAVPAHLCCLDHSRTARTGAQLARTRIASGVETPLRVTAPAAPPPPPAPTPQQATVLARVPQPASVSPASRFEARLRR